jgi:hypothetical protein
MYATQHKNLPKRRGNGMTLEFVEELPKSARSYHSSAYEQEATELKDNPGLWAVVKVFEKNPNASAFAFSVRNGKLKSFQPAGDFQARTRGGEVWARFVTAEILSKEEEVV